MGKGLTLTTLYDLIFFFVFDHRATHNLFMLVNRHLKQNTVIEVTEKQLEKVKFVTTWFTTFPVNITAASVYSKIQI